MIYEIVCYEAKVYPLHRAVCKLVFSEDRTRNAVGIVLHSHDQVRNLIEQLKVYMNPAPAWGEGEEEERE